MERKHWIMVIYGVMMIISFFLGATMIVLSQNYNMKGYDLYYCIQNNAIDNDFNHNPLMIKKIQDECICFREHNFNATDIFANCK